MNVGTTYVTEQNGTKRLVRVQAFKSDKLHYDIKISDRPDTVIVTTWEDFPDRYQYSVRTHVFKSFLSRANYIETILSHKDVVNNSSYGFTVYIGESWCFHKLKHH